MRQKPETFTNAVQLLLLSVINGILWMYNVLKWQPIFTISLSLLTTLLIVKIAPRVYKKHIVFSISALISSVVMEIGMFATIEETGFHLTSIPSYFLFWIFNLEAVNALYVLVTKIMAKRKQL